MDIRTGLVIMGTICLIYIYDSTYLLYRNEAIVIAKFRNRFAIKLGSPSYTLFGRCVYIPNPLFAHRPIYRILWDAGNTGASLGSSCINEIGKFKLLKLAPCMWLMLFASFVLLPIGFYVSHGLYLVIGVVVYFYLTIILLIVFLAIDKKILGINTIHFIGICFESLVCAPCALNIIKKSASANRVRADLIQLSRGLLSPSNLADFYHEFLTNIDAQLMVEQEGSSRYERLKTYRQTVMSQIA